MRLREGDERNDDSALAPSPGEEDLSGTDAAALADLFERNVDGSTGLLGERDEG